MKNFFLLIFVFILFSNLLFADNVSNGIIVRPPTDEENYEFILHQIENKTFEPRLYQEVVLPISKNIMIDDFSFTPEQVNLILVKNGKDFEVKKSDEYVEIVQEEVELPIPILSKKNVIIKEREIYLPNIQHPIQVFPAEFLLKNPEKVYLDTEFSDYKYEIISEKIELDNSYNLFFSKENIQINNTIIESDAVFIVNLDPGISLEKNKEHILLKEGNVGLNVLSDFEIKNKEIYLNNIQLKKMPKFVYEKIGGEITEFNLQLKDDEPVYDLYLIKEYKILSFLSVDAEVMIEVNGNTGEIIIVKEPWWSWLSSERIGLTNKDTI